MRREHISDSGTGRSIGMKAKIVGLLVLGMGIIDLGRIAMGIFGGENLMGYAIFLGGVLDAGLVIAGAGILLGQPVGLLMSAVILTAIAILDLLSLNLIGLIVDLALLGTVKKGYKNR